MKPALRISNGTPHLHRDKRRARGTYCFPNPLLKFGIPVTRVSFDHGSTEYAPSTVSGAIYDPNIGQSNPGRSGADENHTF